VNIKILKEPQKIIAPTSQKCTLKLSSSSKALKMVTKKWVVNFKIVSFCAAKTTYYSDKDYSYARFFEIAKYMFP